MAVARYSGVGGARSPGAWTDSVGAWPRRPERSARLFQGGEA